MNKTDRLLAIVLELQAKKKLRAEDLANTFETSPRTIYRDIQALCEAGVPIISLPGQGYSLAENYFLPPLSFTTEEAAVLLLGSSYVAENFDEHYREAAYSAGNKIKAVLPQKLSDQVKLLQESISFISINPYDNSAAPEILHSLRRAVVEKKTIRLNYHTRSTSDIRGKKNIREVDPYGLIHTVTWYLVGYCHLRNDIRYFRLDRIDNFSILDKTFSILPNFKIKKPYGNDSDRKIIVKAIFDGEIARWVQESKSFYVVDEIEVSNGLLITFRVREEREILPWLLSWGKHVQVLEPESLKENLMNEAKKILKKYENPNCN